MKAAIKPLLVWTEERSVRVAALDAQHKKLVGLLNELNEAMTEGRNRVQLEHILSAMVRDTHDHFATEEYLMRSHAYPDYTAHKLEHDRLIAQVLVYQEQFQEGTVTMNAEVLSFLKDWLVKHIAGSDRNCGAFLNRQGVV